jgi:hypothetical protein
MLNEQLEHTLGPRAIRRALATLMLAVTCLGVVATPTPALAATAPFPFADNNNNGVFDPGVDTDITADVINGYFTTNQSIVLPAGMKAIKTTSPFGVSLSAGKNIVINGDVNSGAYATGLTAMADGDIKIGPGAKVIGRTFVYLVAGRDLLVGTKANITAKHAKEGMLWLSAARNVVIGDSVKLRGHSKFDIASTNGTVTLGPKVDLDAGSHEPNLWSHGELILAGN